MKRWSTSKKILIWGGLSAVALVVATLLIRPMGRNNCNKSFLFLGDSITNNSRGYVEMIQSRCPQARIKKIAKDGATSQWIRQEYIKELSSGQKYDIVNILIGVNDVFGGAPDTLDNIDEIVRLANKNGSKVVFISSPSVSFYPPTTPKIINKMKELEWWAQNNKGIDRFISTSQPTERKRLFASDYLHLNTLGHQVVFKLYDKNVLR